MEVKYIIALDIGSSTTAAVGFDLETFYADADTKHDAPPLITFALDPVSNNPWVSSIGVVSDDGEIQFGVDTSEAAKTHVLATIKRLVGLKAGDIDDSKLLGGVQAAVEAGEDGYLQYVIPTDHQGTRTVKPHVAMAKLVRFVYNTIAGQLDMDPDDLAPVCKFIATVPAYASSDTRQAVQQALQIAGLCKAGDVQLISEPTGAIMHSLVKRKLDNAWQSRDSLVMLVDVGAGTTDITLVKYTVMGSEVQVVATRGNNVMGGLNVTQHLYDTVLDGMDDAHKAAAEAHHKRLFLAVDTLKVKLSTSNKLKKAQAPLRLGGTQVTVTLSSDDLAKACEQTFQPAQYVAEGSDLRSLVTKAVEDARVHELVASDPKLLDNIVVFVAGGSGQLPYVPDQLTKLGYKPIVFTGIDAQMAVVTGALQTALVKHGVYDNIGISAFANAAPYSIAVKMVHYFPGFGGHIVQGHMIGTGKPLYYWVEIIRKNEKLPQETEMTCYPVEGSTTIQLRLGKVHPDVDFWKDGEPKHDYKGNADRPNLLDLNVGKSIEVLKGWRITGITSEGGVRETFRMNENGILTCDAKEIDNPDNAAACKVHAGGFKLILDPDQSGDFDDLSDLADGNLSDGEEDDDEEDNDEEDDDEEDNDEERCQQDGDDGDEHNNKSDAKRPRLD